MPWSLKVNFCYWNLGLRSYTFFQRTSSSIHNLYNQFPLNSSFSCYNEQRFSMEKQLIQWLFTLLLLSRRGLKYMYLNKEKIFELLIYVLITNFDDLLRILKSFLYFQQITVNVNSQLLTIIFLRILWILEEWYLYKKA